MDTTNYSDDWDTEESTVIDTGPLLIMVQAAPIYWECKANTNDNNETQTELKAVQ